MSTKNTNTCEKYKATQANKGLQLFVAHKTLEYLYVIDQATKVKKTKVKGP